MQHSKAERSLMVDPARRTGLLERSLRELSEISLGEKNLIQTRTIVCLLLLLGGHTSNLIMGVVPAAVNRCRQPVVLLSSKLC